MLIPTIASASNTLTAAMIPSRRLVVSRLLSMSASERNGLMRVHRSCRSRSVFADCLVQHPPALAGHVRGPDDRRTEVVEFLLELVEHRQQAVPEIAAALGEEQIAHERAQCGA